MGQLHSPSQLNENVEKQPSYLGWVSKIQSTEMIFAPIDLQYDTQGIFAGQWTFFTGLDLTLSLTKRRSGYVRL